MMPAGHHSDSDSTLLPLPKSSITWLGGIFARLPPLAARLLRFLPVTHDIWELPGLTYCWIHLNKYPHLSTTEAKILIGRLICTSKDLKKKSFNSEVLSLKCT